MAQTPDPYEPGPSYGFSYDNARRISRVTKAYEGNIRVPPTPQRNFGGYVNGGIKTAVCGSGGIAAGSVTSPTSGTITIYDQALVGSTMTGTARSTTDTAYNNQNSAVTGSSTIKVAWIDGYWFVINGDC